MSDPALPPTPLVFGHLPLLFGHVELRPAERRLLVDGQPVALGARGFDLLCALVARRERAVGKDELLDEVWPGLVVEENNLQVQVSGLRRVLGAEAISTVQGFGYRFTLAPGPRPTGGAADVLPPRPAPLASVAAARVLVADDNRVNRLLLCRSLELMGHEVLTVGDGHEALALLQQQHFELLLLDLAMPGLDGFGLLALRHADATLREVPVIVTSALGGVAPVARCIELGVDDFLHKPVDPWLLRARVDASLERHRLRQQQAQALRRLGPTPADGALRFDAAVVLAAGLHGLDGLDDPKDRQPPEQTLELVSDWGTLMVDAIAQRGGALLQFTGDTLLARFEAAGTARLAAQDMVALSGQFNDERRLSGQRPVCLGIGIACGPLVVGTASTAARVACACIGAVVGRAQRLAAACAQDAQDILLDDGLASA
ncbi:MAG: response regulator [Rubrivivax sp.]|nr:response regulator [Rubrivivax sp.]